MPTAAWLYLLCLSIRALVAAALWQLACCQSDSTSRYFLLFLPIEYDKGYLKKKNFASQCQYNLNNYDMTRVELDSSEEAGLRQSKDKEEWEHTGLPRVPLAPFSPGSPGWPMSPRVPTSPARPGGPLSPWKQTEWSSQTQQHLAKTSRVWRLLFTIVKSQHSGEQETSNLLNCPEVKQIRELWKLSVFFLRKSTT